MKLIIEWKSWIDFNMEEKFDINIKSFYIFNPKFGTKEGEVNLAIFIQMNNITSVM